jgi:hypothetical protein
MDKVQAGCKVTIRGSHDSVMCGFIMESLLGCTGTVLEVEDGFAWVEVDGVKYLLTCDDLGVI